MCGSALRDVTGVRVDSRRLYSSSCACRWRAIRFAALQICWKNPFCKTKKTQTINLRIIPRRRIRT